MGNCRLKIFCDFDGTITKNDVWLNSLARFIPDKEALSNLTADFINGKIDSKTVSHLHLELVKNFDINLFRNYLAEEEIDPSFPAFAEFCEVIGHQLYIVSSGLDFYISEILNRFNLKIPYFGSKMIVDESKKTLSLETCYSDEYCTACAVCKRNILLGNSSDLYGEVSVFIGGGASDFCVSRFADIVFAKKHLASFCWKNNITYFEFTSFDDVRKKLDRLSVQGKLKTRQEASVRRKDVFLGG